MTIPDEKDEIRMPAQTRDLTSTVVAVTGASSGIGAAAARLLLEAGARVVVQARREERLNELVEEFGTEKVVAVPGDVRKADAAHDLVRGAVDAFGRLDSIVVSAGVGAYGGILDASDEDLEVMLRTNIDSSVWGVRAAVQQFRAQASGGDIVIISSVAGLRGGGSEAVYAATKFAQVGLAGSLDREVRPEGIRVSTICPAGVQTEFAMGSGRTKGDPALDAFLQPQDIGAAVVTVLSQPRRMRTTLWAMWSMAEES